VSNFRYPKEDKIKRWNVGNLLKNTTPERVYGEEEKSLMTHLLVDQTLKKLKKRQLLKDKLLKVRRRNLLTCLAVFRVNDASP